jgi:hypothetical protein
VSIPTILITSSARRLPFRGERCREAASTDLFHGRDHGSVPVSMLLVHNRSGEVPELHRYPYAEVLVLRSGPAPFQMDDVTLAAAGGDVVIARSEESSTTPAGQAALASHRFVCRGRFPGILGLFT